MTATRYLLLFRHAEAGPHLHSGTDDLERPLTQTGILQARCIGRRLREMTCAENFLPTPISIICSPAKRTLQTAELFLETLAAAETTLVVENTLYGGNPDTLYGLIHGQPKEVETTVIIGHNPTIGALASELAGRACVQPTFATLNGGYPPATLTVYKVHGSWIDVRPSTVRAQYLLTP